MVHWRKLTFVFILSFVLANCIPTATCEDNLKDNKIGFKNFYISKKQKLRRSQIFLTNSKDEEIELIEEFGILLFDVLQQGDIVSKKVEENIVITKRGKYVISYEMYCDNNNSLLKIDTLSR
jgi:hypothetical protein